MSNTKAYPSKEIDLSESQIHGRQIVYDQHSGMEAKPRIDINEFESILLDLAKRLNDVIYHLDPNISGQVDEIYQLENIQSFISEVHSEVFTYDEELAKGKYTNQD